MKSIHIEKLTLNIGAGKNQDKLEKGLALLNYLTGMTPIKTVTQKRIPTWGLRPGLPIGCKVTVRKEKAKELLKRLLDAKSFMLEESQFDENGSICFGIPEYIDIKDIKYNPDIGIMGLEVCITLYRKGFRIKRRKIKKKKVSDRHRITREEAIEFMKKEYGIKIGEEE